MSKKNNKDKKNNSDESETRSNIHGDAKRSIVAIFLFAVALLILLGFFEAAGILGSKLDAFFGVVLGWGKWISPIVLVAAGIILLRRKETSFYVTKLIGLTVAFWSLLAILHIYFNPEEIVEKAKLGMGGGYAGLALALVLRKFTGVYAGTVILLALMAIGYILAFNLSVIHLLNKLKEKIKSPVAEGEAESNYETNLANQGSNADQDEAADEVVAVSAGNQDDASNIKNVKFVGDDFSDSETDDETKLIQPSQAGRQSKKSYRVRNSNAPWEMPPLNLLEESKGVAQSGDVHRNMEIIQKTFQHFGIEVEPGDVLVGPTVTQYSFRPAVGVKLSKIVGLSNDLSLALAAPSIRIEAPIPGKSLVGIEVPNKKTAFVRMRDMLQSTAFHEKNSKLTLALGKDISGNFVMGNLEKMPHLMIAGSTGSGKSVCINTVLLSLLYQNTPEDLKMILVDPKRVELSLYNGIPHLICDVIVENNRVISALKWAVGEMEKRYRLLQDTGSRDITSYNQKVENGEKRHYTDSDTGEKIEEELAKLPFIVIVIDELADLMASHGKEVESAIVRLAQMARAVGIHLIVSTQRPSVEVITGLIKANIITRIAFQVATQIDSRTILDMSGAEKLLGNGDMLFQSASSPKPKRLQGVYVSEAEVKKVVKFIKDQRGGEDLGQEMIGAPSGGSSEPQGAINFEQIEAAGNEDSLYEQAKELVIRSRRASTSLLQRHLRVGYSRAARLIDTLEEQGIIGPGNGAKPREVLVGQGAETQTNFENPEEDQEKRDKWDL